MDDAEKKKLIEDIKQDEVHVNALIDHAINTLDIDKDGIHDIPYLIHEYKIANKAAEPYKPLLKALLPLVKNALPHVDIKSILGALDAWVISTKHITPAGKPIVQSLLKAAEPVIEKAFADAVAALAAAK